MFNNQIYKYSERRVQGQTKTKFSNLTGRTDSIFYKYSESREEYKTNLFVFYSEANLMLTTSNIKNI